MENIRDNKSRSRSIKRDSSDPKSRPGYSQPLKRKDLNRPATQKTRENPKKETLKKTDTNKLAKVLRSRSRTLEADSDGPGKKVA